MKIKNTLVNPVQVWKLDEYEPCGPALFMPVQRIAQRYASCSVTITGHKNLSAHFQGCFIRLESNCNRAFSNSFPRIHFQMTNQRIILINADHGQ